MGGAARPRIVPALSKAKEPPITKNQIRQMIQAKLDRFSEFKYVDATTLSGQTITTSMNTVMMSAITAGTSVNGRIGESVIADRLDLRLQYVVGDATNVVRFLVLVDLQPNGASFNQTDLFENAADPFSPLNWQFHNRFKIIHDETFGLDTYNPQRSKAITVPLSQRTTYNGTSNSIANITTGAVYCVWLSDSGAVPQPTVSGDIRLWFRDD
jgi:hypothetical protein